MVPDAVAVEVFAAVEDRPASPAVPVSTVATSSSRTALPQDTTPVTSGRAGVTQAYLGAATRCKEKRFAAVDWRTRGTYRRCN